MFDVELFIEAVKGRPALYNPSHEHYNRKEVRTQLWDEIGQIMFPEWSCLDDRDRRGKAFLMQKKWKSLKDCFNRELRLRKTQHPNKVRKQYEFYKRLSFLHNKQNPETPQEPSSDVEEVLVKTETSTDVQNPVNSMAYGCSLIQPFYFEEEPWKSRFPEGETFKEARGKREKRSDGIEDSDRLFLMSFVNDLKRLPLSTKYWVKMKFSEIMHQATIGLDDDFREAEYKDPTQEGNGEVGSMA